MYLFTGEDWFTDARKAPLSLGESGQIQSFC